MRFAGDGNAGAPRTDWIADIGHNLVSTSRVCPSGWWEEPDGTPRTAYRRQRASEPTGSGLTLVHPVMAPTRWSPPPYQRIARSGASHSVASEREWLAGSISASEHEYLESCAGSDERWSKG